MAPHQPVSHSSHRRDYRAWCRLRLLGGSDACCRATPALVDLHSSFDVDEYVQ
jgi:hypothetical protein